MGLWRQRVILHNTPPMHIGNVLISMETFMFFMMDTCDQFLRYGGSKTCHYPPSIEMAMAIVPVVTVGWASVTCCVHFSAFIPMTLLPFLFQFLGKKLQPRVNFPESKLIKEGMWT